MKNLKRLGAAAFIASLISLNAGAQQMEILDYSKNPFGLVYENAITENKAGQVNIHPVSYMLNGNKIVANVYTPAGYDPAKKYAAVVVSHPNGGVKEQTAGLYAQRLAGEGYITIAADASYQGGSGGEPRYLDIPQNRINDVRGMVDYISQYPGVDPSRIGALGICGGGGYTYGAIQSDKRIKAASMLSMFNTGRVRRLGFRDSQMTTVQQRLKEASEAREAYAKTGKVSYIGWADKQSLEQIKAALAKLEPGTLYHDGMEYYSLTHVHPNSFSHYTTASLMDLMMWDTTDRGDLINIPILIMSGSKSDTDYMSRDAYVKASAAPQKEFFVIDGASHIQTYYVPEYVDKAVGKMKEFFGKNL